MDIDIDVSNKFSRTEAFPQGRIASMVREKDLVQHPVGMYFQNIPIDEVTGLSAIPYDAAEDLNFRKFDFLHLSLLDVFQTREELLALSEIEPDWSMLMNRDVVKNLFHIHRHYDLLQLVMPKSIQELADCIALIRPAKKHMIAAYLNDPIKVRANLYAKPIDDKLIYFKKSHAIAYAVNIVIQMNLISGGILVAN